MTFMINGPAEMPKIQARAPQEDLPTFGVGLGAATTSAALENDANFIAGRRVAQERREVVERASERLGRDEITALLQEQDLSPRVREMNSRIIMEAARAAQAENPEAWDDIDLSEEGVQTRANESLQAEYNDAQQILEMMPEGRGFAEFVGGMVGVTADVKNLPFLILGGGSGSIFRVMGREASINMAAEGAFLPSQFDMAERLDIPDPSIPQQLALAAVAGGAFGGAVEATRRGYVFFRNRNRVSANAAFDELQQQMIVDQTEDILTSDTARPFEQIDALIQDAQRDLDVQRIQQESPLSPSRPPVLQQAVRDEDAIATARAAVEEAEARDVPGRRPLAQRLRNSQRNGGENLQIDPDGEMAQELRAAGITPRSVPGLFSRAGRRRFDNLSASEFEETFPGIIEATGTERGANYLDEQGFRDVLVRDIQGDGSWRYARAEADQLRDELERLERASVDQGRGQARGRTETGDQQPIDNTVPTPEEDRIRTQAGAPRTDDVVPTDDGTFDLSARSQLDVFSEPSSLEAQQHLDIAMTNLRDDIEQNGDIDIETTIEFEDGRLVRLHGGQETADFFDTIADLGERINMCGRPSP